MDLVLFQLALLNDLNHHFLFRSRLHPEEDIPRECFFHETSDFILPLDGWLVDGQGQPTRPLL